MNGKEFLERIKAGESPESVLNQAQRNQETIFLHEVFCVNTIYMESLFRKVIKETFPEFPPIQPPNIA